MAPVVTASIIKIKTKVRRIDRVSVAPAHSNGKGFNLHTDWVEAVRANGVVNSLTDILHPCFNATHLSQGAVGANSGPCRAVGGACTQVLLSLSGTPRFVTARAGLAMIWWYKVTGRIIDDPADNDVVSAPVTISMTFLQVAVFAVAHRKRPYGLRPRHWEHLLLHFGVGQDHCSGAGARGVNTQKGEKMR